MLQKKRIASWLFRLGNRLPDATHSQHLAQLHGHTSDQEFVLYLEAIAEDVGKGFSYGQAIERHMEVDIPTDLKQHIESSSVNSVDAVLRDSGFQMLERITDQELLSTMFDRAACRYDIGAGPPELSLRAAMTTSFDDLSPTRETVNVSFRFADGGQLNGVHCYAMSSAPASPIPRVKSD